MHKLLLRAGILVTLGMLTIGIISGCGDDDPPEYDEIKLLTTFPEDGGIISAAGALKMTFDGFPKSVYVDGKSVVIQDNTATVKITDLPNVIPGIEKTVTVEWRNQGNFLAGSKTITFTVLKFATRVEVDPAPPLEIDEDRTQFILRLNQEVVAVTVNGATATGSGQNWSVWSYNITLGSGLQHLDVKWKNRDGSTGSQSVGPYEFVHVHHEPPSITSQTVTDGAADVDPAPINQGGFRFDFNEPITGSIALTDEAGVNLDWQANVAGQTATLTVIAGQELVNETTYKIEIDVHDGAGNQLKATITFVTKPK